MLVLEKKKSLVTVDKLKFESESVKTVFLENLF